MEKNSKNNVRYVKVKTDEDSYRTYKLNQDEKLVRIKNEKGEDDFRVIGKDSRLVSVRRNDGSVEYREYKISEEAAADKNINVKLKSSDNGRSVSEKDDLSLEFSRILDAENKSSEKASDYDTKRKYKELEVKSYENVHHIRRANKDYDVKNPVLRNNIVKQNEKRETDSLLSVTLKENSGSKPNHRVEEKFPKRIIENSTAHNSSEKTLNYSKNRVANDFSSERVINHKSNNKSGGQTTSGVNTLNRTSNSGIEKSRLRNTNNIRIDRENVIYEQSGSRSYADNGKAAVSYNDRKDTINRRTGVFSENKKMPCSNRNTEKITAGTVVKRCSLVLVTVILAVVISVFSIGYTLANGPSPTIRNQLVLMASQSSAMKWAPRLFLSKEVVDKIISDSQMITEDVISIEDYFKDKNPASSSEDNDKFKDAKDGMIYETVNGPTFKAYVLLVKDPSRVSLGISSDDFKGSEGIRFYDLAKKYNIIAAINGGEYPDGGGGGNGSRPIGLTYSDGKCVWDDGHIRSFVGFTNENKLVASETMTRSKADEIGIRDGCCFQTGKTLISNEGDNIKIYRADSDTGTAQRTAIGQCADGSVILVVTDGRSASSLGATHNDIIDLMVSYGAICAGMLDGGSSTMMYYENYFDKYEIDKNTLDEYQKMGLVNKYKAFTTPRRIPTYFIVSK